MRITQGVMNTRSLAHLQNNLKVIARGQEKLASGKNINRASDDPVGMTRVLDITNTMRLDERYGRNIQDALSELGTTDSTLKSIEELIQRASELAVKGSTFGNSQDQRDAMAAEIDNIIDQVVQLGNTKLGDKYLLAGFKTSTAPFGRSGDTVSYSGTPPTEDFKRSVEIAPGISVDLNLNGQSVLGTVAVAAGATTAGSSGPIETLMELRLNLQAGNLDEVRNRIDELAGDVDTLLDAQATIGALTSRLEMSANRLEERKTVFSRHYAEIQDIDMAETIANLNAQQSTFEASLAITARLFQSSLLSYL